MLSEVWFPAAESKNVVGRFVDVESVDAAKTREAEAKGEPVPVMIRRPALQSKIVGSHDVSVQLVKPFNASALRSRFVGAWEHYEAAKSRPAPVVEDVPLIEQTIPGTPLHKADFLPKDRVAWLALQGVQTIEQLRDLSDGVVQNMGRDVAQWRKKADAFLKRT